MVTREILEKLQSGQITLEEAESYLKKQRYDELGYAKLDTHREIRSGFPEVIYCSGKPDEFLVSIYQKMYEEDGEVFGTRASEHQYELVKKVIPEITYDSVSHILKYEKQEKTPENSSSGPCPGSLQETTPSASPFQSSGDADRQDKNMTN